MAVAIKRLTPKLPRYPWAKWMNGKPWRAEKGVDFTRTVRGFLSTLYSKAERAKPAPREVETRKIKNEAGEVVAIEFQFSKPRKAKRGAK